ncbi:putative zinc ribbon protein [Klebsiella pneumoniae]
MFAKSFIALDGNGRLTGARTAQTAPYDRYTCHMCNSTMQYHPEYNTERPWFEHTETGLTSNGRQHCPYANPDAGEMHLVRRLQLIHCNAAPRASKADWHCSQCAIDYYGERYCLTCSTGDFSQPTDAA